MTQDLAAGLARLHGRDALETIWTVLPGARLVGGCVRDLLAGREVADFDLAAPEPPEAIMQRLRACAIRVVPTGLAHGTVTAVIDDRPHEITTLRRDVETDGRHAVVAWTDDWQEDAARRDFTINAMSLDRAGHLHDYFGGAADLTAGRVRFVGRPGARIEEDALRILRFFRFQARYGSGEPDADAVAAIAARVPLLRQLSAERVWSELRRLLQSDMPSGAVRLMRTLGVLDAVLPGGGDPGRLEALLAVSAPNEPVLRLAALACGPAPDVAGRLRLSKLDAARLAALQCGPRPEPPQDDDALRRLLADEAAPLLCERSWLTQSQSVQAEETRQAWDTLRRRLLSIPAPVLPLSGDDAIAVGLPAGPAVGAALRVVGAWWRAGGCVADRAACLARLEQIAASR